MRKLVFLVAILGHLFFIATTSLADSLLFSVNTGNAEEASSLEGQEAYQALASYLSSAVGAPVKVVFGQNATTELQRTRTGYYAILLAPAHMVGSALKNGYEPVAKVPGSNKAVFVASKSSNIQKLDQAKGKRLGLPNQDSLATYLAKGELNALGFQLKSYFSKINYSRYQDSALFSLGLNQADVVVVDEDVAKKWLVKNAGVIVMETQAVPGLSVAVNSKIPQAQQDKIRNALLQLKSSAQAPILARLHISSFESAKRENFQYVSTLGYFTPKVLQGASVITAEQAKELMGKGAPLFDTRVEHEYKESHVKGAISVPYKENSPKEVDFDETLDVFDLGKLPKDKNMPLIFACNGAECWKSYKSAKLAIKNQYTKVYWFRGGYPEWKSRGYPVE